MNGRTPLALIALACAACSSQSAPQPPPQPDAHPFTGERISPAEPQRAAPLDTSVSAEDPVDDTSVVDVSEDLVEDEEVGQDVPEPACVDLDLDGFFTCLDPEHPERPQVVDCDDSRFASQPGGVDFEGNGIDDDCDGEVDEVSACTCPEGLSPSPERMALGLGLCQGEVLDAQQVGHEDQHKVTRRYLDAIEPPEGGCMVVLSTGASEPTAQNNETGGVQPGSTFSSEGLPDPLGGFDQAFDTAQLRLTLSPPGNALGLSFSFMFLSAEWPEYLCQIYNDTFYALINSQAVMGGETTNVSFDRDGSGVTVNVAFFEAPQDWTTSLTNTPFGVPLRDYCPEGFDVIQGCELPAYCDHEGITDFTGSGTGWLTSRAPIERGEETIDLVFSIHDEGDSAIDSTVVLRDFRWLPFQTSVGTVKE